MKKFMLLLSLVVTTLALTACGSSSEVSGDYTPGTYFGMDPLSGYTVVVVINEEGGIDNVVFDAQYKGSTKNFLDEDYTLGSGNTWKSHADALAAFVVENQGWDGIGLVETAFDSTWTALTVPNHIIDIDADNSPDAVAGVSIGAEGFVFAWNAAIAQASSTDLGVITTAVAYSDWTAAHAPAFNYTDGVYFGMDEAGGYFAKVTVKDGFIVDVFFDALYSKYVGCEVDSVLDANVSKGDCVDPSVKVYVDTTKQALQEDYTLGSGVMWATEADELAGAIVDAQEWSAAWDIILGTDGGKDLFDVTDPDVIDAVAGVTIGIQGFKVAFEEAIGQAE